MNIVSMLITTLMAFAVLDELLLWMRCRQLCREARDTGKTQQNNQKYATAVLLRT